MTYYSLLYYIFYKVIKIVYISLPILTKLKSVKSATLNLCQYVQVAKKTPNKITTNINRFTVNTGSKPHTHKLITKSTDSI